MGHNKWVQHEHRGGASLAADPCCWVREMTETIQQINDRFSTADAEDVAFSFDGADLVLHFTDWREVPHEILFPDTILVRWDELLDERFRYDTPHEILNSGDIAKRTRQPEPYHHYMLCFNAASNLEVISHQLIIRKPEQKKTQPVN